MTVDRIVSTVLLLSFLVIAIPAVLFFRKLPNPDLTPPEKELMNFTNQPVSMSSPLPQTVFSGLGSPVKSAPQKAGEVIVQSGQPSPVPNVKAINVKKSPSLSLGSRYVVSMIYYAGSTRMAIIDDHVVHEGSALDGGVIEKIEKTRVLIRKSGKGIWLTTE